MIVELDATTAELRPEMTARADILVGTRANVLLVPVNAIFEHRGQFVAHAVRPSGIETRPVDIGESNDLVVEVVNGLSEGDRVLLTEPSNGAPGATAAPHGAAPRAISGGRSVGNALQPR